jgi:hypothetical protein
MVEIVWQDPPTRRQRPGEYEATIAELKKHPGRWALIASDWKTAHAPNAFRQAGCEITARRNKDTKGGVKSFSVFARFPQPKLNQAQVMAAAAEKSAVRKAVQTGTALTPPPPVVPRAQPGQVRPANDMGMTKFLADRRARGAVNVPE